MLIPAKDSSERSGFPIRHWWGSLWCVSGHHHSSDCRSGVALFRKTAVETVV